MSDYRGILCIGDPHLCTWAPGYRKDDYPLAALGKLRWALNYARENDLLPVLLGDLFHAARDNANWLMIELMELLDREIVAIVGNHDRSEDLLCEHDSLAVLLAAGRLRRIDQAPWIGQVNGVSVAIGGTSNGQWPPRSVDRTAHGNPRWLLWITHHDYFFGGEIAQGQTDCHEIAGVDLVVNGHIHRTQPDVVRNSTRWCNPGNISRVGRSEATFNHIPTVLQISLDAETLSTLHITVPHQPFAEAFYPAPTIDPATELPSSFIAGLQAMQKFKTADGEGLRRLIEANLPNLSCDRVKKEILSLLSEVLPHAGIQDPDGIDRATA